MLTDTAAALTVTTPLEFLSYASRYEKLPGFENVYDHESPGFSTGDAKPPCCEITWWLVVSEFVQVTVSFVWICGLLGTNPAVVIATLTVFADAGTATTRAAATATRIRIFVMRNTSARWG